MAVPKTKISKSRRGMRRSHHRMDVGAYHECQDTGELKLRHHISPEGWYRGKQVLKAKAEEAGAEQAAPQA